MLMNDVNTSPLFYGDSFDHFHCVFRGMKQFVLIDTKLYPDVRQVSRNRAYQSTIFFSLIRLLH